MRVVIRKNMSLIKFETSTDFLPVIPREGETVEILSVDGNIYSSVLKVEHCYNKDNMQLNCIYVILQ